MLTWKKQYSSIQMADQQTKDVESGCFRAGCREFISIFQLCSVKTESSETEKLVNEFASIFSSNWKTCCSNVSQMQKLSLPCIHLPSLLVISSPIRHNCCHSETSQALGFVLNISHRRRNKLQPAVVPTVGTPTRSGPISGTSRVREK